MGRRRRSQSMGREAAASAATGRPISKSFCARARIGSSARCRAASSARDAACSWWSWRVLIVWFAFGIYRVQPDEQGVELVFGKWTETTTPGLHYNWPAPIGACRDAQGHAR